MGAEKQATARTVFRAGVRVVTAVSVGLVLWLATPAGAQTLGGLGHRSPSTGGSGNTNDNAPRRDPAPDDNAPRRNTEPDPAPPPAAPEPSPAPQPTPTPEPKPAPPAPAPAPPEARPVTPPPAPADNAPVNRRPRPDDGPEAGAAPQRSRRVTTPIGQRPAPRPSDGGDARGGDYLYPPPAVIVVPPVIATTPPFVPPPAIPAPSAPTAPPPAPTPPAPRLWADGTHEAAFADIERAWAKRDLAPLRRHVRDGGTQISVSLNGRYAYSLASRDFLRLTRDALARLDTLSFRFTRLRKANNGDVTAYGRHVYRTRGRAPVPATTAKKTVYVSYTLRRQSGRWVIVGVGSSPKPPPK